MFGSRRCWVVVLRKKSDPGQQMSDYGQRVMLLLHRIEEAERLEEVKRLRPASDVTVAVQSHVCAVALRKLSDEGKQVMLSLLCCR